MFLRLDCESLPPELRDGAPGILWLEGVRPLPEHGCARVSGKTLERGEPVPLVAAALHGSPELLFDLEASLQGTLLERYRAPPAPTLEMRLPFNYSRLPNWLKGLGRMLRGGQLGTVEAEIPFPPAQAFPVEFLHRLARWCGIPQDTPIWPSGHQGGTFVSHDVDVDWLFHHPQWLERILDLEEEHGFRGVWFVVPRYCRGQAAERAMTRIRDRGHELGCHGYNHDAKLPFVTGSERRKRLSAISRFAQDWDMKGFRSEWLWRTPAMMADLAVIFRWDSSVPSFEAAFSRDTFGGCGSLRPFRGLGGMVELPLTLAMDVDRVWLGQEPEPFWQGQFHRARQIADGGGLVVPTLHPQPHQGANDKTLAAYGDFLSKLARLNLWQATPSRIAEHWQQTQGAGGESLVRSSIT